MFSMDRRLLLGGMVGGTCMGIFPSAAIARQNKVRLAFLGQCLIEHAPTRSQWPGRDGVLKALSQSDLAVSNFESVILGPRAGAPTRDLETLHTANPDVLDTLYRANIRLVGFANNHAFDLGTGGILDTLDALEAARMTVAGAGVNETLATKAGFRSARNQEIGLVAYATGKVRPGGAATPERAGVNEVRVSEAGVIVEQDANKVLSAIADAKRKSPNIVVCHHNHLWEPIQIQVPAWQREFAKRCVDAGASIFIGHGVPMVQGMEIYRGVPLLYGLGNFVFQTEKPVGAYPPQAWQGVIATGSFKDGICAQLSLACIMLNEIGLAGPSDTQTRGFPRIATLSESNKFFEGLKQLSQPFGTRFVTQEFGVIELAL
jgi:poly-gamma-glutamate capsule biosynthesis protein CapA/YwtB (metallophosphatase superfamily)